MRQDRQLRVMPNSATITAQLTEPTVSPAEAIGPPWAGWILAWSKRFSGFYGYHQASRRVTRVYCDRIAVRRALERGETETVEEARRRLGETAISEISPRGARRSAARIAATEPS